MGILALKLWHLLVMLAPRPGGRPPPEASWQALFEALQNGGLRQLDFGRAMRGLVLPTLNSLATGLAVPYVVTRGVLPLLGLPARWLQYAGLYGYTAYHGAWGALLLVRKLREVVARLHNAIRDDRYLVGRQLKNFTAREKPGRAAAAGAAASAGAGAAAAAAAGAAGGAVDEATATAAGAVGVGAVEALPGRAAAAGGVGGSEIEPAS
jgi:hypothetical protein